MASSTLVTESFPGSPSGMNLALPADEIGDTEAQYIQDALLDFPGLIRRRGPLQQVGGIAQPTRPVTGLAMTLNPQGVDKYGVLNGDNVNGYFSVWSDDLSALVDLAWPHPLPTSPSGGAATAYRIVDVRAAQTGGVLIGVSSAYGSANPNQDLALWCGGNKANYSTGTVTMARGSATVTGVGTSWLANAAPGMFLFASTDDGYTSTLIGTVLQVNSDTSLTLASVSPYPATAKTYTLQSLRGLYPKVITGKITCDTTGTTVSGGDTKFSSQGLSSGSWNLYRATDMAWIGKVASVQSEISLTLAASAAVSMADDSYVALKADGDWSITTTANSSKVGFLTATYAERQWYANNGSDFTKTYTVWFSDPTDIEALDVSSDGDWLEIVSDSVLQQEPLQGVISAYNALLLFKENETFGITGSSPSQFTVKKLADDGVLSGMSIQPYGGGVIWAGREGIQYYDGINVNNLTVDKLGQVWKNSVHTYDPSKYRMYSMVNRDHYMLYIENLAPTVAPVKGTVTESPTSWGIIINMVTKAVTMATNLGIRGAIILPAATGKRIWYVVNGKLAGTNNATTGFVLDGESLFDAEALDDIVCVNETQGPDFYYESKKFDAGDPLLLKRFKQLAVHYLAQGGDLKIDVVLGLNNLGTTLTGLFPASVMTWTDLKTNVATWDGVKAQFSTWNTLVEGVFVPKRVKFMKRSQHLSFRLYQSNATMTRVKMGPFQIGYKLMRAGRV